MPSGITNNNPIIAGSIKMTAFIRFAATFFETAVVRNRISRNRVAPTPAPAIRRSVTVYLFAISLPLLKFFGAVKFICDHPVPL